MKKPWENNVDNTDKIVQLLNWIFKSVNGLENIPKIKIEWNFKESEIEHLVIYFSSYISYYISNDTSNSELYISKNKKTWEIFIHENKVDQLVHSEKQIYKKLMEERDTKDHINYLKEETNYLINVKTEIIKLISLIEYDKDLDFGGINIDKINFIEEFIRNYNIELSEVRKEKKLISKFLYLFESIKTNHYMTLNMYEVLLKMDKKNKHFYRDMKTEIYNFINKMIEENKKTKNDLK